MVEVEVTALWHQAGRLLITSMIILAMQWLGEAMASGGLQWGRHHLSWLCRVGKAAVTAAQYAVWRWG